MSKRLYEEMCKIPTRRTRTTTIILRAVLFLDDEALAKGTEEQVEFGAFVHVDDVAAAIRQALEADPQRATRNASLPGSTVMES
jgi:nucleoside-diphosphate-sugar epimerase